MLKYTLIALLLSAAPAFADEPIKPAPPPPPPSPAATPAPLSKDVTDPEMKFRLSEITAMMSFSSAQQFAKASQQRAQDAATIAQAAAQHAQDAGMIAGDALGRMQAAMKAVQEKIADGEKPKPQPADKLPEPPLVAPQPQPADKVPPPAR